MKRHSPLLPFVAILFGCTPRAAERPPSTADEVVEETAAAPLPELTADERAVMEQLERHLSYFSDKVGERNEGAPWELADAADYIAAELEGMGLPVERQGYETQNVAAQNLAVTLSGGERGDQIFVVGAHYDSPAGDRGQNAGGSGAAALLTLVELMKGARLKRTLRFVFFSMGESPHGDGEARGARHYARLLTRSKGNEVASSPDSGMQVTKRAETVGFLHLDRLGGFTPRSAGPAPLSAELTVTPGSEVVRQFLREDIDSELVHLDEKELVPGGAESDLAAFYGEGIAGVSFRGTASDGAAVQYEELSRVVMQLRRAIGRISGEKPTNDGMLTPLSEQIR